MIRNKETMTNILMNLTFLSLLLLSWLASVVKLDKLLASDSFVTKALVIILGKVLTVTTS